MNPKEMLSEPLMQSTLPQVLHLLGELERDDYLDLEGRQLLEYYLPDYSIPWPTSETKLLCERIITFYNKKIHTKRNLNELPQWSQVKLAKLQITLTHHRPEEKNFLFFIAMEIHWSHHTLYRQFH